MEPFISKAEKRVHVFGTGKKWGYRFERASIDGKRRREQRTGFSSKRAAKKAGIKAYEAYQAGGITPRRKQVSFAEFLDLWFDRTKLYARNNTLEMREKNIRLHLKPALGAYALPALKPEHIEAFVQQKRREGFSYETVDRMLSCIHTALDYAIWPMQLMKNNPAAHIRVPKNESAQPRLARSPRRRLEDDEIRQLFAWYPFGNAFYMPFLLALYFGTRIGETIALSWNDCDREKHILSVRYQIQRLTRYGKPKIHYYCDPKTDESARPLVFDEAVMLPLLLRWKRQQEANEREYGDDYFYNYLVPAVDYEGRAIWQVVALEKRQEAPGPRLDLICTHPNGKYLKQESITYQCRKIRERGIEGFDFHTLRHTNLTILGESQVAPTGIMARAGHTDYQTTLKYYVDRRPSMQEAPVRQMAEKMQHLFG